MRCDERILSLTVRTVHVYSLHWDYMLLLLLHRDKGRRRGEREKRPRALETKRGRRERGFALAKDGETCVVWRLEDGWRSKVLGSVVDGVEFLFLAFVWSWRAGEMGLGWNEETRLVGVYVCTCACMYAMLTIRSLASYAKKKAIVGWRGFQLLQIKLVGED